MSKYAKLQIQKEPIDRARGPGRPRGGKSSDPSYTSTTVLLRKDLKKKIQLRAFEEDRELSDIIGLLIEAWLDEKVKI